MLYERVVLESVDQCRLTLDMLFRRIDIARHVRELIVRPQVKHVGYFGPADSSAASAAIRRVASAKCLDALVSFKWEADELPFYDDMWFALRAGYVLSADHLLAHLLTADSWHLGVHSYGL